MNELIRMPSFFISDKISKILKAKNPNYIPRDDRQMFSINELSKIEELVFDNSEEIWHLCLKGIDLLPNLKSLKIKSLESNDFTPPKYRITISDEDASYISKCQKLEVLEICNQLDITSLDVSKLKNLKNLSIISNHQLKEIKGLNLLTNLQQLTLIGNESITQINNLDKIILDNKDLDRLNLDILLYPDAIGFDINTMRFNNKARDKIRDDIISTWQEQIYEIDICQDPRRKNVKSLMKPILISYEKMKIMHNIACGIVKKYIPPNCDKKTTVLACDLYLSENVSYDYDSFKDIPRPYVSMQEYGQNGAYNAFIYGTCVCEGYTRAMQYLLKLKGIKSRNIHCIGIEDHLGLDKEPTNYTVYKFPDDWYHSIIYIEDICLYDDPCWNAIYFQNEADKNMPFSLFSKWQMSLSHTFSFIEKNVNSSSTVSRSEVKKTLDAIISYKQSQESYQNNNGRKR